MWSHVLQEVKEGKVSGVKRNPSPETAGMEVKAEEGRQAYILEVWPSGNPNLVTFICSVR